MAQPLQDPRRIFPPSYLVGDATPEHLEGKGHTSQLYPTSQTAWTLRPPTRQHSLQNLLCLICSLHLTPPVRSWEDVSFLNFSRRFVTTTITTHHHRGPLLSQTVLLTCACVPPSMRSGSKLWSGLWPGWGVCVHLFVANSVPQCPSFEVPPCRTCAPCQVFGGLWNTLVHPSSLRYRARQPSGKETLAPSIRRRPHNKTTSVGRNPQPPSFRGVTWGY